MVDLNKKRKLLKLLGKLSPEGLDASVLEPVFNELEKIKGLIPEITTPEPTDLSPVYKSIQDIFEKLQAQEKLTEEEKTGLEEKLKSIQKDITATLESLRSEFNQRFAQQGGGAQNRKITIGGADPLKRYTDINYVAGTGVTISPSDDNTNKRANFTFSASVAPGGTNGQIEYNNNGVFAGIPGSAVNSGTGNIVLSGDISLQTGGNLNGIGSLIFSGSGGNAISFVTEIDFDGQGGGLQNFGDSTALLGSVFDMNTGNITNASQINTILNSLDNGSGDATIFGQLGSNSISTGQIAGTTINGSTVNSTGDIIATNNIGGGGIRLSAVAQGSNTVATISDFEFSMDASSAPHTVTFPIIGTLGVGKMYLVLKTDSTTNAVTPTPTPTNTMNNGGAGVGYAMTKKNQYTLWMAVGSNWQLIGQGYLDNTLNSVALTTQSADITTTNFVGGNTAGTYRVDYSLQTTTADGTAGTVTLTLGYTDGAGATTFGDTQGLTGTGRKSGSIFLQLASGNITYAISHTGSYGTSKYALYLTLERLS